jgi:hypothetical protein
VHAFFVAKLNFFVYFLDNFPLFCPFLAKGQSKSFLFK